LLAPARPLLRALPRERRAGRSGGPAHGVRARRALRPAPRAVAGGPAARLGLDRPAARRAAARRATPGALDPRRGCARHARLLLRHRALRLPARASRRAGARRAALARGAGDDLGELPGRARAARAGARRARLARARARFPRASAPPVEYGEPEP